MKLNEKEQLKREKFYDGLSEDVLYEWIQYNAPYTDRQQSFVTTFFEKSLPFDKFKSTKIDWVIRNTDHEQFNYFEYIYNLYSKFSDKKLDKWIKFNEPFYDENQIQYIRDKLDKNDNRTLVRKNKIRFVMKNTDAKRYVQFLNSRTNSSSSTKKKSKTKRRYRFGAGSETPEMKCFNDRVVHLKDNQKIHSGRTFVQCLRILKYL